MTKFPPIINPSTLTEEQREAIKAEYADNIFFCNAKDPMLKTTANETLEWLFGEELFKSK
ncbi:MAG: hypothetical protein HDS83_03120 [Bacteroidales bacterium]|nr:hypothetical protein [Bacteroidales bacterium]